MKAHLIADLSAFGNQSDKPVCFVKLPFFKVNWTHCGKLITNGDISGCELVFFTQNDMNEPTNEQTAGWQFFSLFLLYTTRCSSFTPYELFSLFFLYSLPSIYWEFCIACCMNTEQQHCIKLNDFRRRLHTLYYKKSCSLCILLRQHFASNLNWFQKFLSLYRLQEYFFWRAQWIITQKLKLIWSLAHPSARYTDT